ncbi:hypothetical protein A8B78_04830 [Jannaschia sp. EhC01]|uniref:Uncharacterized protein n=1 Tax=Gymnodinialimonas phycosphaerae TaxID=2841589 RepID=A0A975TRJ6_9RHOB|nr:hypothetical protein [Gymnodinialimonas phycosphaerae]MBY4893228.1 hypothetical protein [Gymnodinialimonas phycosphaerae]OAN70779.1 hypothetical protein A8B78_04830 [Jannaschia sp. EhC01]
MKLIYPVLAAAFLAVPSTAEANPIQRACMASDRYTSRSLCSCIGEAADATLSRSQMREGARWFDDPQRAQDTRQSDRERDEEMWQAWRTFSSLAEQRCG